ncbi:amino acid/amide ABC transporter substrate-binding protein, HAAT family [Agrococcus baldri]|uniref:Amino acid/amide ABC transporter substrate-binding protein, HAAT family n=1 Tax=Agrococcus baldri TaxID=153730 RepID=A0AA94KYJ6_9MICO|nr:substrate-binding domain-containing protein [Agrococcus baldri]SFR99014.1 amino acid/amide ABC transporter substrate-binding protein, HAAT family [Agrococcus baldri]
MRRTTKFAGVGIAIAALALTACAPTTAGPDASEPAGSEGAAETVTVDVGMITSITGPLAAYGATYQQGFEAGLDYATDGTGEIEGIELNIEWLDDQGNPDTAVNLAKDVIGQGYQIIGGSAASGVSLAVAEQAAQNNVLFLSGPAAADAITGINEQTFRSGRQTLQDVATAATFLDSVEGSNIVVFGQDNAFGQGNVASVEAVLGAEGATVTPILVPEDATEFTPFAQQIAAESPDMVFVAWAGATTGAMWEALAQQQVLESTTVVTGLADRASYQAYGPGSGDIQFLNHYFPGATDNEAAQAMDAYLEENGYEADLFTPDGFVGAQMLVHAITEAAGDVDGMIAALEGWTFESVKGELTIRAEDHALIQPMFQVSLVDQDGEWVPELVEIADAEAVAPPIAGE